MDTLSVKSLARSLQQSRKVRGFQHHLIAYVLVIALLVAVNLATSAPYWVLWVAAGWGIGLLAHGFFALRSRTPTVRPSPAAH